MEIQPPNGNVVVDNSVVMEAVHSTSNAVRATSFDWSRVDEAMQSAVRPYGGEGDSANTKKSFVFPGAVLLVGRGGEVVYRKAFGCRSVLPDPSPMHEGVVFDVASLTKVMVTTTLAMQLVDRGLLDVDRRLSRVFQTFSTHGKERMTIRHLLTHTSGYPATFPFYRHIAKVDRGERTGVMSSRSATEMVYNEIFRGKLENLPGKVTKYSDIGFILLGDALEVSSCSTLDKLAPKNIFQPLGLPSTGYIELAWLKRRGLEAVNDIFAPTSFCPWRNRILNGEVHDDNAWALGGVAAHAGVFSTIDDVHAFASHLTECWHGRDGIVNRDVLRRFWTRDGTDPKSSWALGWDTPSESRSSSGKYFSEGSVGHLSYTGCSLWIDPKREIDVVLLSNRIHPSVENNAIHVFRPLIHDLIMETMGMNS